MSIAALRRCSWCTSVPAFLPYHDEEWGFPVDDNRRLFEKLCLESFQSGLSWRTILAKRENFRAAFCNFDFHQVAGFDADDVDRLLQDKGIVRHRGKINAVINNAKCAVQMSTSASLAAFFWRYEDKSHVPSGASTSAQSVRLAKDLKSLGWKFVGPTTAYAFMQAMGVVNDHALDCFSRPLAQKARARFSVPIQ